MSVEADSVLPPELPVKLSPTFPPPASLSEHPQLAKPRPPIHPKNGHQPHLPPPPPPPPANQRGGKRRFSVGLGFKGVAKRRRRFNSDSQAEPVLPSHFLLGGNIFDPLNLNSLLDEEVNRATNQETPRSSPLPSRSRDAVQILVPRDITDPLNLNAGEGDGVLVSPLKSRRRHRYRQHGGGGEKEAVAARLFPPSAVPSVPASPLSCELNTAITCRDDVAPPPILPRRHTHPPSGPTHKPGNHGRRRRTTSIRSAEGAVAMETSAPPTEFQTPLVGGAKAGRSGGPLPGSAPTPQKKKDKLRYQYGNHCRYYGYQASYSDGHDGRVGAEEDPRLRLLEADWFREKTVLDVGCGAGHMTLAISRKFGPAHILGVELDGRLVHAARQNIRHFLSHDLVVEGRGEQPMEAPPPLPLSFRVSRGPLSAPPLLPSSSSSSGFPGNITFIQETTLRNFRTLRIRPEHFTSFLTDSVGFSSYRLLTHTGTIDPDSIRTWTAPSEPSNLTERSRVRILDQNLDSNRTPSDPFQVTTDPSTCSTKAPPTGSDIMDLIGEQSLGRRLNRK
uniref:RNA methyltransferase n=1 Tax=Cyprinodon variegatus TaxID=28743 RepID=A0A3Q2DKT9_CYPVA